MTFTERLQQLGACSDAVKFSEGKTLSEAWTTCERGDWMLWLYRRAFNFDKRKSTLAKGHCANTIRHLMKDPRSTAAVDAAIAYGNGEINDKELDAADAAAYAAAADAAAYAAYAAAADAAAYAAYAAAAAASARKKNQMETADICRKYLPIPEFN